LRNSVSIQRRTIVLDGLTESQQSKRSSGAEPSKEFRTVPLDLSCKQADPKGPVKCQTRQSREKGSFQMEESGAEQVLKFKRSSFCSSNSCVEVSIHADTSTVYLRNSRDELTLVFSFAEWSAFVSGVQAGEFSAG
jgi:hypothetical protein